ncbi:MAG: thiamine pyrophosphate-dependent dehydrogenase E1 component subunit alpha [Anaerolineaceae bacterium]
MTMNKEKRVTLYRSMLMIRRFEEKVRECFLAGEIPGFIHPYLGEEAVAAGVCSSLEKEDKVLSHHRGTGHAIALGVDPDKLMAELFGKRDGTNGGRVGQMHVTDKEHGLVASNGIVGGALPLSVGAAFFCKYQNNGKVAIAFCGDGGAARGTSHEAMQFASVFKLPLILVIENNLIAGATPFGAINNVKDLADRAGGYGIPGVVVDGNDVEAVYEVVGEAAKHARNGEGPSIIECKTWRMDGHFIGDPGWGKEEGENEEWKKRDPISSFTARLIAAGDVTQEELDTIDAEVTKIVEDAADFARQSPYPTEEALTAHVYAG